MSCVAETPSRYPGPALNDDGFSVFSVLAYNLKQSAARDGTDQVFPAGLIAIGTYLPTSSR